MSVLFVATGDTHVGKLSHLHPDRLGEQERVWRAILTVARDLNAAAVLHAGDAFDRRRPSPDELLAFERPLVEHHNEDGCPVIAISGNGSHDASHGEEPSPLQIMHEADLLELYREPTARVVRGVRVALMPWTPTARLRAQLGADVPADETNQAAAHLLVDVARGLYDPIGPTVLLTHFSVGGALTPEGASVDLFREPILDANDLAAIGYDAVICGHIHKPQIMVPDPAVFYVGSPMPLTFGEGDCPHGYWTVELDPELGLGRAAMVPLESPRFLTFDQEIAADVTDAYVRLRVTVPAGERVDARWLERDILETGGARYARVEVTVERAARGRVEALDDTVSEQAAFTMWLDAVEATEDERPWLLQLDQHYREQVAA